MKRVIISGGGTGGHIFPAIAIADELKRQFPNIDILFVGALGKMEMEKVPLAGYNIVGLPIVGLQRSLTFINVFKNLVLPFRLLHSLWLARKIVKTFRPQVVIGVGGYASGPTLQVASFLKIPTLIQEQNSFAGKTNRLLGKRSGAICVAYSGMERFFPKDKLVITGNPVRNKVWKISGKRYIATEKFACSLERPIVLVVGGSLGAKTLNEAIFSGIERLQEKKIQVLWQCGSYYYKELTERLSNKNLDGIYLHQFIEDMDLAYSLADVVVSRAGAIAISELCLVGKATIFVPSPNVAEDHQTHNANALVKEKATIMIPDRSVHKLLITELIDLLEDQDMLDVLSYNIRMLGKPNATKDIVKTIVSLVADTE